MTIVRSGYAPPRNGSTRAQRKARAETLRDEQVCATCGLPGTETDPLEASHVIAHANGGPATRANMRAEHRSHNRQRCNLNMNLTGGSQAS